MLSGLGLLLGGGYVIGLWILSGRMLSFLARDYRWRGNVIRPGIISGRRFSYLVRDY